MAHRRKRKKKNGVNQAVTEAALAAPAPVEIAPPIDAPSELVPIPPQEVDGVWPLAEQILLPELPRCEMTADQFAEACKGGAAQLWFICDQQGNAQGALITMCSAMGRCVVAVCCGPNLWDYLDARHQLYQWAKGIGMREVVFYGRDALVKLMPECKRGGVILRKEL